MFAIITFRKSGPIKTWSAMRATNVHNARTRPLDHAVPGAPGPQHLIGSRDLVSDVKRRLHIAKIDPDRLRKNGVIAYEAILTASAEFFDAGDEAQRAARLAAWTKAQVSWASDRYGPLRIASMVLHQDEKTPHIHLVVLPLEVKSDGRRVEREPRWGLVGRTISGPGRFDEVQDAYAAAMAPFGLVRGVRGSGRKHEPVPVYLARLAAKEQAIDDARIAIDNASADVLAQRRQLALEAAALEMAKRDHDAEVSRHAREEEQRRRLLEWDREAMFAIVASDRRALVAERVEQEKAKADHVLRVENVNRQINAAHVALRRQQDEIAADRAQLVVEMARTKAEAAETARALCAAISIQEEAEQERADAAAIRDAARVMADKIEAHRKRLLPTLAAAADFRKRLASMQGQPLTPAASSTQLALSTFQQAASTVKAPEHEVRANMLAAYARIRHGGSSIAG